PDAAGHRADPGERPAAAWLPRAPSAAGWQTRNAGCVGARRWLALAGRGPCRRSRGIGADPARAPSRARRRGPRRAGGRRRTRLTRTTDPERLGPGVAAILGQ